MRPSSVWSTHTTDIQQLKQNLSNDGFTLSEEKKPALDNEPVKGMLWFEDVDGIVIEIPRTIYPL